MNAKQLAALGIHVPQGDELAPAVGTSPSALAPAEASPIQRATDYEAKTIEITADQISAFAEFDVYQTSKRWTGVDVYVSLQVGANGWPGSARLSVFVWAISKEGERTLVATGRFGKPNTSDPAAAVPIGRRVVAARAAAERFVVSVLYTSNGAVPVGARPIKVTVVAADELAPASKFLGSLLISGVGKFDWSIDPQLPHMNIVWISGSAGVAGGRWLQLRGNTMPNGSTPDIVWPMGSGAGDGFVDGDIDWRSPETVGGTGGGRFLLAVSSTISTLTLAIDSWWSAIVR